MIDLYGRSGIDILASQFDGDDILTASGDTNNPWSSISQATYMRNYFLSHVSTTGAGYWDNAAHHLVDYVKVWDVPKNVSVPSVPR